MKLIIILLTFCVSICYSQSWESVGGGTNGSSHGLLTYDGKLVDLGSFNGPCNRVALWDGITWECLGDGVGIVARSGTVWNGNLVVVGDFWNVQQPCVDCNGIAMWDGTQWTNIGTGFNNDVLCVITWNGELIASGDFTLADGNPCNRIAKWNGTTWLPMGGINDFDNDIRCMAAFDNELWIGGDFNNVGGNSASDGLVKWDEGSSSWVGGNSGVDLVGGVNESVRVLYVNPNDGNLYMGGEFPELIDGDVGVEDYNMSGIAMYDGSNWTPLGTGLNEYCRAIHEYNGNLIAGGYFTTAGGVSANKIAKWNGSTWSAMGLGFDASGIDEYVKSATVWNGIFFAGGAYTQAEGAPMNYVSQWFEAVANPPIAQINASAPNACEGSCIYFSDNSTNAPTSWTWSFPGADITSSSAQIPGNICYSTAGNYTVSLQSCNANGCDNTTYPITISSTPSVTSNNPSICEGDNATLIANPSIGGGTYSWSPGGENTSSIVVSPAISTNYTVTYYINGCASVPSNSMVTVNPIPSIVVNSEVICEGENATLLATPSESGGEYLWTPTGEISNTVIVSPIVSTSYTVEYTLNACTGSEVANVTVNPTYSINESVEVCENELYTYPDGTSETIIASVSHTSNLLSVSNCDSLVITNVTMSPNYSLVQDFEVCENSSFTYPDGTISNNIVSNESHTSNLQSAFGCDSVITTNLSLIPTTNTSENLSVCEGSDFIYPDGTSSINIIVNESHVSALQSIMGCDSNVTTNLSVIASYNTSESFSICEGSDFTYPDGTISTNISVDESHISVLQSIVGCDSNVNTNLNVIASLNTSENFSICEGDDFTYPDGTTSINIISNESHLSVLQSSVGCDSNVTTNLSIIPTINTSETIAVCEGENYTYPDGSTSTIMSNETHISYLQAVSGCDSLVTTNVIANPIAYLDPLVDETICYGESVNLTAIPNVSGGNYLWSPGNETSQSINVSPTSTTIYSVTYDLNSCGTAQESVTITVEPEIDNSTSMVDNVITATQLLASYQWLDCNDGMAEISGETNQDYAPSTNGLYAVNITVNGCLVTSECVAITTIGVDELNKNEIRLFPNPAGIILNIEGGLTSDSFQIENALGQVVMKGNLEGSHSIDVMHLSTGVYYLIFDDALIHLKFVKN